MKMTVEKYWGHPGTHMERAPGSDSADEAGNESKAVNAMEAVSAISPVETTRAVPKSTRKALTSMYNAGWEL